MLSSSTPTTSIVSYAMSHLMLRNNAGRQRSKASSFSNGFKQVNLSPKLLGFTLSLLSPLVFASPAGGNISVGMGAIDQSGANTTISQQSQNLAIDWQTFSIGAGESVNFNQPNASSIALNQDASSILGSLTANGQVFILNPNGVLFGSTAQVTVGGLAASTLNLSDTDFVAGNYRFSGTGGSVINQGALNAADGGYIALLAPEVRNEGVITTNLGTALMAAADQVTLSFNNGSLLSYTVDQGALNALAENNQIIQADGGHIIMTARAADALSSAVVNNTGIIEARTVQNVDGTIWLNGDMQIGKINVSGILDADNSGFISISAAHVTLDSAEIISSAGWLINSNDLTINNSNYSIQPLTLSPISLQPVFYGSAISGMPLSGSIGGEAVSGLNVSASFTNSSVGGLVETSASNYTISGSYSAGQVTINSSNVGGLVGMNSGTITYTNVGLTSVMPGLTVTPPPDIPAITATAAKVQVPLPTAYSSALASVYNAGPANNSNIQGGLHVQNLSSHSSVSTGNFIDTLMLISGGLKLPDDSLSAKF